MSHLIPATVAVLAALVVVLLINIEDVDAGTSTTAPTSCSSNEKQVVGLLSDYRVKNGRVPYTLNQALCQAAELRCKESLNKFYPVHVRPDGTYFNTVLDQFGITYRNAGEFTHFSRYSYKSPASVVNLWLQTEIRRTITLYPQFNVAAAAQCSGGSYGNVTVFLTVKP